MQMHTKQPFLTHLYGIPIVLVKLCLGKRVASIAQSVRGFKHESINSPAENRTLQKDSLSSALLNYISQIVKTPLDC